MDSKEAFKIGFLSRCVEEGLSQEKTAELAEKAAALVKSAGVVRDIADVVKGMGLPAVALAATVPVAAGGGAAYLYNKATDVDGEEVEEIKQKELAEEYARMADQLRRQSKLRKYKKDRESKGQVFF